MIQSVMKDAEYQMSLVKRNAGESDEDLARRLFYIQKDVLAANVGSDLVSNFDLLKPRDKKAWIEKTKTYQ